MRDALVHLLTSVATLPYSCAVSLLSPDMNQTRSRSKVFSGVTGGRLRGTVREQFHNEL